MPLSGRTTLISAAATALATATLAGVLLIHPADTPTAAHPNSASTSPSRAIPVASGKGAAQYRALSSGEIVALPEARYNAVIPGLLTDTTATPTAASSTVYRITKDAALYGADKHTPIARLDAQNFLHQDTVIVATTLDGPWTKILTPARRTLPSEDPDAPAQTAAWIRTSQLIKVQTLTDRIVVSISQQTVRIMSTEGTTLSTFPAGIGAPGTPTPTGVTGYLQARYLDPKQDQTIYPIGLTSLHSAAADEPYGGNDGGLIGIHYNPVNTGTVSHGCIRLDTTAIEAIDQLPLGTPVSITS